MTIERFIRKWLANPAYPYSEQSKDEMRDDLDEVISRNEIMKEAKIDAKNREMTAEEFYAKYTFRSVDEFDDYDIHICRVAKAYHEAKTKAEEKRKKSKGNYCNYD